MRQLFAAIDRRVWISGLLLSALALVASVLALRNGANYNVDQSFYMGYALGVRGGYGVSMLANNYAALDIRHVILSWPPLYPIILALIPFWDDPRKALFVMSVVGTVASVALVYLIAYRVLRQLPYAILATLLFITAPPLHDTFSKGASETAFLPLVLLALLLTLNYRLNDRQNYLLTTVAISVSLGLAVLVRTFTIICIGAILLYLLVWAWSVRKHVHPIRLFITLFIVALSVTPFLWFGIVTTESVGNPLGVHNVTAQLNWGQVPEISRSIALESVHGVNNSLILLGVQRLQAQTVALTVFFVGSIALVVLGIVRRRNWRLLLTHNTPSGLLLMAIFAVVFVLGYAITAVIIEKAAVDWIYTGVRTRHLLPCYPILIILLIAALRWLKPPRLLSAVFVVLMAVSTISILFRLGDGTNFNQPAIRTDSVLRRLHRIIPEDTLVVGGVNGYMLVPYVPVNALRYGASGQSFFDLPCDQLYYPRGFDSAAFILVAGTDDNTLLNRLEGVSPTDFLTAWAAPCGVVERIESSRVTTLVLVRLDSNILAVSDDGG